MNSNRAWTGEWPNLSSVSVSLPAYMYWLPPASLGILYRLVAWTASRGVHSFFREADPDPRLPNDIERIIRIAGCTLEEWQYCADFIEELFVLGADDCWRLKDESTVRISKPDTRGSISGGLRTATMARDGRRCVYCGDVEGPFHIDHLFPVSRGGSNNPNNLVLACAPCNLAKGDKTLAEWVGR